MPNSDPAWVRTVQVAVTVNNVPVIPIPSTEVAAGGLGSYAGVNIIYQPLVSWTVNPLKAGKLDEVSFTASNYAKAVWRLTIAGVVFFADKIVRSSLEVSFEDLSLLAGAVVLLEVKSFDGTSITANGIITGKE